MEIASMFTGEGEIIEASKGGFDLALGLSRTWQHAPRLVQRFAEHVNAKTYWDFFNHIDPAVIGRQTLELMQQAKAIRFNLDGLIGEGRTLKDVYRWGAEGIGHGNVTNWEFFQVVSKFRDKATFYLEGKTVNLSEHGL